MSKGLDLIKRQQPEIIDGFSTGNVYIGLTFEELAELEKELKDNENKLVIISEILVDISKGNYSDLKIAIEEIREVL